jgi:hypothetical protein
MARIKTKKKSSPVKNISINNIEIGRTGGQIALGGFNYQLLYSCYMVLNFLDNESKTIKLEGIEDVDLYKSIISDDETIYHIQLKFSKGRQDASFFDSILKNFIEVYLADKKNDRRFFKLVYDAEIANGNLSKLIAKKLDKTSREHWNEKINKLKKEHSSWEWTDFNFDDFCEQLRFEKLAKTTIEDKIKKLVIERFSLDTGNENLFVNTLFYNVFHKAQNRNSMTYRELLQLIQDTKDDIAKGYQNPSYQWIDKINFDILQIESYDKGYFEGKKASPADIVSRLPIRRERLEDAIKESIRDNQITVIKSSSGQGKTTLAWQVAYSLRNEYSIYKLNWCKDSKEISNIIEYFNSRLKLGEKVLIVIDNLDEELKEWNKLSQSLSEKIRLNYSILVTTREEDWYSYSGDQSNLCRLKIIDIFMDANEAKEIYDNLKARNRIHVNIINWQSSWEKVQDRKLLIEYIYLLTHGEMIQDRITYQLKKIADEEQAYIKFELLRQIALSDIIGVRLTVSKLLAQFEDSLKNTIDLNSIISSIKDEYFIKIDDNSRYIEGLHPVRSQHIVNILHEYNPISKTLKKLLNIVDDIYICKIYSQIPLYIDGNIDELYSDLAASAKTKSYSYLVKTIQGVFSGSILKYFKTNKAIFDDADLHGGLFLFLNEINPWNSKQFGAEVKTLEEIHRVMPGNKNIEYLLELSNTIKKFEVKESDFYIYSYYLYMNLKNQYLNRDITEFASLANWLIRVDKKFDIVSGLNFDNIWAAREDWDFEELALLMYEFYNLSKEAYLAFISKNKDEILSYLRIKTNSLKIYEDTDAIHIEYILLPQDSQKANEESVSRINNVCKLLPIYETYFTDTLKPHIDFAESFYFYDQSHKEMPIKNVLISFNVDLFQLWNSSILSHYEFESVYDWQYYWIDLRKKVVEFAKLNIDVIEKLLKQQNINKSLQNDLDEIRCYISNNLIRENAFPHANRPFEEKSVVNEFTGKIKHGYFNSITNYLNQFFNIIQKNEASNLAIINLKDSRNKLHEMQQCFDKVCSYTVHYFDVSDLVKQEKFWIDRLIVLNEYYLCNAPSKGGFNHHIVALWNQERIKKFSELIDEQINVAAESSGFTLIKPVKVLAEGNLTTVLVGVKDLDISYENNFTLIINSLITFAEIDVNYILLIMIDEQMQALPTGIRINTSLFKKMKECIETNETFNMDIMSTPFPCVITQDHLNCLKEHVQLKSRQSTDFEGIDTLLIALWEYTQYLNNMNGLTNEEKVYLSNKLTEKTREIEKFFNDAKDKIPLCFIDKLTSLKNAVIKDKVPFMDIDLNNWLNEIVFYLNKNRRSYDDSKFT